MHRLRRRVHRVQVIGSVCLAAACVLLPYRLLALDFNPVVGDQGNAKAIDTTTGNIQAIDLGKNTPTVVAFNIINAALSLLAALCLGLLIYAGFLWVWARGNPEEVKKAKDIIIGTVLGLIVVLASLGITTFVFQTVAQISGASVSTT